MLAVIAVIVFLGLKWGYEINSGDY